MRVFVSSTTKDLGDARKRVCEQLLQLDIQPVSMDWYAAGPKGPQELDDAKIRSCDAFVIIVGDFYGSSPPDLALRPSPRARSLGGSRQCWRQAEFNRYRATLEDPRGQAGVLSAKPALVKVDSRPCRLDNTRIADFRNGASQCQRT